VFIVESFNSLKTELASLTPIRKGIDPREIFTDVWHWIFGWTNRIIAERGFFYDPPKEREGEGRYIAWIEEENLQHRRQESGAVKLDSLNVCKF
jgi:hypothetical protein